jgi:hypothetical protein
MPWGGDLTILPDEEIRLQSYYARSGMLFNWRPGRLDSDLSSVCAGQIRRSPDLIRESSRMV